MGNSHWKASEDIQKMKDDIITLYHPDLVPISNEIIVVFKEKSSKSGDSLILGNVQKASPVLEALGDDTYYFIIILGEDGWAGLNTHQKQACLDHFLLRCLSEFNTTTGEYKLRIRKPEIVAFREEVERWGAWWPNDNPVDRNGNPVLDNSPNIAEILAPVKIEISTQKVSSDKNLSFGQADDDSDLN